jgi:hypothetical protein
MINSTIRPNPRITNGSHGSDLTSPVRAHVLAALVPTDEPYPPPVDKLLTLGNAYHNPSY